MENNRTLMYVILGGLVGLCVLALAALVIFGGVALLNRGEESSTVVATTETDQGTTTEGTSSGSSATASSNSLRLLGGEPPTLDPALASDATSANYIVELFSGLVTLDENVEIVPDIAADWRVSDDGLTYTFTLRDDVTFADGSAVTAEDFKYTIERACDPATLSPVADTYLGDIVGCKEKLGQAAGEVSGVRVIDPQTLEITIDAPKVYFLAKLTYPTAFVVDQAAVQAGGNLWATTNPNGSGPFRLDEYRFGERLVLAPNENYYGDPKPSLDRVTYILSGGSGMTMYETDEVDVVGVGLGDIDRVLDPSNPLNADLREVSEFSIGYIGLNANQPPFDDPQVRQAFNLAIDKEALVTAVLNDTVVPAYGIIPPGMPGHDPNIEGLRFNAEEAQRLLAESSYGGAENLPDITLHVSGAGGAAGPQIEAIVEMWKRNLAVDVAIEQTEWATFLTDIDRRPNPYQAFSIGWIADYPDPENFLDLLFHCDSLGNRTGYCNAEVDALLEEARVEQDNDARMALYDQAQQLIVQDAAWVPLWFNKGYVLVKPYVQDYRFPPTIVPTLKYVKLAQ